MSIVFVNKDIFTLNTEAVCNPVNCVGVMGRGLALQFKHNFRHTDYFEFYKAKCRAGKIRPGKVDVSRVMTRGTEKEAPRQLYIVNFPTKDHWRDPSQLSWIIEGLESLKLWINTNNIKSIAIPRIGSGLGGLTWQDVREQIERVLANVECRVVVCE